MRAHRPEERDPKTPPDAVPPPGRVHGRQAHRTLFIGLAAGIALWSSPVQGDYSARPEVAEYLDGLVAEHGFEADMAGGSLCGGDEERFGHRQHLAAGGKGARLA